MRHTRDFGGGINRSNVVKTTHSLRSIVTTVLFNHPSVR